MSNQAEVDQGNVAGSEDSMRLETRADSRLDPFRVPSLPRLQYPQDGGFSSILLKAEELAGEGQIFCEEFSIDASHAARSVLEAQNVTARLVTGLIARSASPPEPHAGE